MDKFAVYSWVIIAILYSRIAMASKGYCSKSLRNGIWESRGDCDDSAKASVLKQLDEKLEKKKLSDARTGTASAEKESFCFMGLKSRAIPDPAVTASSMSGVRYQPSQGRLDNQMSDTGNGAWCVSITAQSSISKQWIQVDFESSLDVAGVITQGDPEQNKRWVTSYKVAYGNKEDKFAFISEGGSSVYEKKSSRSRSGTRPLKLDLTPVKRRPASHSRL